MSKDSIELSPKHGVNATIPICFWCGKEKNQIAMLGRIRKRDENGRTVRGSDVEAPMKMVLDYEPCDSCMEVFNQGVHLVECTSHVTDGRPAFTKDDKGCLMYPTGRSVTMKPEAAKRIFRVDESMLEAGKKLCLDEETFNGLVNMLDNN